MEFSLDISAAPGCSSIVNRFLGQFVDVPKFFLTNFALDCSKLACGREVGILVKRSGSAVRAARRENRPRKEGSAEIRRPSALNGSLRHEGGSLDFSTVRGTS